MRIIHARPTKLLKKSGPRLHLYTHDSIEILDFFNFLLHSYYTEKKLKIVWDMINTQRVMNHYRRCCYTLMVF